MLPLLDLSDFWTSKLQKKFILLQVVWTAAKCELGNVLTPTQVLVLILVKLREICANYVLAIVSHSVVLWQIIPLFAYHVGARRSYGNMASGRQCLLHPYHDR